MAAMLSVGLRVFRRCGDDTLLWIAKLWGSEAKLPENALAADVESGQLSPSQLGGSVAVISQNALGSKRIECLSIGDLAPTESGGDSGQNCI